MRSLSSSNIKVISSMSIASDHNWNTGSLHANIRNYYGRRCLTFTSRHLNLNLNHDYSHLTTTHYLMSRRLSLGMTLFVMSMATSVRTEKESFSNSEGSIERLASSPCFVIICFNWFMKEMVLALIQSLTSIRKNDQLIPHKAHDIIMTKESNVVYLD